MTEALHAYLADLRSVVGVTAAAAYTLGSFLLPLGPGWWAARKLQARGTRRLTTVAGGGAVAAFLWAAVSGTLSAGRIADQPAPDMNALWPLVLVTAAAAGVVVFWPAYTLLLHLLLRRSPPQEAGRAEPAA